MQRREFLGSFVAATAAVALAELARERWRRATGERWKAICWQFGIARATAHRRYQYGLSVIAWRLNGRRVPGKRSKRYVITMAACGVEG